jgi:hypothetical protein
MIKNQVGFWLFPTSSEKRIPRGLFPCQQKIQKKFKNLFNAGFGPSGLPSG